jgi:hypothetical protein
MTDIYLNLIDPEDLELTATRISAKALALVQSIGTGETEEIRQAIAAKARAYFKRSVAIRSLKLSINPFPSTDGRSQIACTSRRDALGGNSERVAYLAE